MKFNMLRPFITVEGIAEKLLEYYKSIFSDYKLISLTKHKEPHHNLVMLAIFSIKNQEFMISDSFISHEWKINPGISFFIDTIDKNELSKLSDKLSKGGKIHMPIDNYGFSTLFTWVEDKFGVNWQLNLK